MFSILPLQLATNIFIPETSEDNDRYYGFDRLSPPTPVAAASPPPSPSSGSLPRELAPGPLPEMTELEVTEDAGRFVLASPPPTIRSIILCESVDAVAPIQPGDLCVVSQRPKRPLAFFMPPQTAREEAEEFNAVLEFLRRT
jgi:hypothetical protein